MLTQAISTSAIQLNTTIRPFPTAHYFVVIADPTGDYIPESSISELCRDCVISDIAGGQHRNVRRVIAADLATGKTWDASKEVAREVLNQCIDIDGEIGDWCIDFLEEILGCNYVRACCVEAAA